MILSRAQTSHGPPPSAEPSGTKGVPSLEEFLKKRDYTGAISLLEFQKRSNNGTDLLQDHWIGYCYFHLGDYRKSMKIYEDLVNKGGRDNHVYTYLACCYFFLGMYNEANNALKNAPMSDLKLRLQFHLAHKLEDEKIEELYQELETNETTEDVLSVAAFHYMRGNYQDALDIYKRLYISNRELIALNVYMALCYYKLGYSDVSQETLQFYLQKYPDSIIALNLKACNEHKLNGKVSDADLKTLSDRKVTALGSDIIKHNLVAFKEGIGAMQVLPKLVDVIPEARLNLVIFHLRRGEFPMAFDLLQQIEPVAVYEFILKAIVNVIIGQETGSREYLQIAQQHFQLVGDNENERDTIPGRQCLAAAFFLQRQFEDVHLCLTSFKSYIVRDDSFNFNYAQAKTALGLYKDAEDIFVSISNEKILSDYVYLSHLTRCFIMNKKPQDAWELYLKMETSPESFALLQLFANDCYRMGHFYHAAKAFDLLERLDSSPEHWEGKRGACVGLFQLVIAKKQPTGLLSEIIQILRNSTNSQVEGIIKIVKRWAKENRINVRPISRKHIDLGF